MKIEIAICQLTIFFESFHVEKENNPSGGFRVDTKLWQAYGWTDMTSALGFFVFNL
jgi:hypothetical protein